MPRRRPEAEAFRAALLDMRDELDWSQREVAAMLGVSKRTLSSWECGYWLPTFRQRLHVVLSLRHAPPEHVLEVADALGVSVDPAAAPFLEPFRRALGEVSPVAVPAPASPAPVTAPAPVPAPAPAPAPVRIPPDPERLRGAMDAVVRDAADAINVAANELRAAIASALTVGEEVGATVEEMRGAVAVRGKGRGTTGG